MLEIETNEQASDFEQAFSAGLLEGKLTQNLISLHLINTVGDFCSEDDHQSCSKLIDFLTKNFEWINEQIEQNPNDPYWHHVNLVFAQFYGLYHGFYNITIDLKQIQNFFKDIISDIKPYLKLL